MEENKEPKVKVQPRLNKLLKELKWTQLKLAEKTGIPQGSISRFDTNKSHVDNHLFSIAKALGKSVEDLFEVIEIADEKEKESME